MGLIGVNPAPQRQQQESTLDQIAKAITVANAVIGTGIDAWKTYEASQTNDLKQKELSGAKTEKTASAMRDEYIKDPGVEGYRRATAAFVNAQSMTDKSGAFGDEARLELVKGVYKPLITRIQNGEDVEKEKMPYAGLVKKAWDRLTKGERLDDTLARQLDSAIQDSYQGIVANYWLTTRGYSDRATAKGIDKFDVVDFDPEKPSEPMDRINQLKDMMTNKSFGQAPAGLMGVTKPRPKVIKNPYYGQRAE